MYRPFADLGKLKVTKSGRVWHHRRGGKKKQDRHRFGRPVPLRCAARVEMDEPGWTPACRTLIQAKVLGLTLCPEHLERDFAPHSGPSCAPSFQKVYWRESKASHAGCKA